MRIGFFADMYLPHVSGVTNHITLAKRYLEDRGHEVTVFTFGKPEAGDAEHNVVRSPGMPWGGTGWRLATGFSAETRRLAPKLDIAHVHHPFQSGRLVAPIAHRHGIPLVFTNHTRYDLYSDSYARLFPRAARYGYVRGALHGFADRCDEVIAPSETIAEWLLRFAGVVADDVIPNGVDTAAFASPKTPLTREALGFAPQDVVFCYVGRLGPEKGTRPLAEEFAHACAVSPRARLLVIGDGPARRDAEIAIAAAGFSERARFVGMVPYEHVPDYEAAADVFVTASVTEVHPLVVLEAMAAGLPVIGVRSPGISDTVEDGVSGLLAPDATPGSLAERIALIAGDDALRTRLARGARKSSTSYTLENTVGRVLLRYEELLGARSSS